MSYVVTLLLFYLRRNGVSFSSNLKFLVGLETEPSISQLFSKDFFCFVLVIRDIIREKSGV